mgnify:FL=1
MLGPGDPGQAFEVTATAICQQEEIQARGHALPRYSTRDRTDGDRTSSRYARVPKAEPGRGDEPQGKSDGSRRAALTSSRRSAGAAPPSSGCPASWSRAGRSSLRSRPGVNVMRAELIGVTMAVINDLEHLGVR